MKEINCVDKDRRGLLFYFCLGGSARVEDLEFLVSCGANKFLEGLYAESLCEFPKKEIMEYFISKGESINTLYSGEFNAVHNLCADQILNMETLLFLHQNKADFTVRDLHGLTPFYHLIKNERCTLEMVKFAVQNRECSDFLFFN